MVVYLKLKRQYFNEGTQADVAVKFEVNGKALSKLLTGHNYMGRSDLRAAKKRKEEWGKVNPLPHEKKEVTEICNSSKTTQG